MVLQRFQVRFLYLIIKFFLFFSVEIENEKVSDDNDRMDDNNANVKSLNETILNQFQYVPCRRQV